MIKFISNTIIGEINLVNLSLTFGLLPIASYISCLNGFEDNSPFIVVFLLFGVSLNRFKILLWGSICLYLSFVIAKNYFILANHHFLSCYISLLFVIAAFFNLGIKQQILEWNSRWLIVLVIGLSAMQKLFSPNYLNGSFYMLSFAHGAFFPLVLEVVPSWAKSVESNQALIKHFIDTANLSKDYVQLKYPFSYFNAFILFFIYFIVISEIAISLLFILFHESKITHYCYLITLSIISLSRPEYGFLSLMTLLGFITSYRNHRRISFIYLFIIVLFFILRLNGIGYP